MLYASSDKETKNSALVSGCSGPKTANGDVMAVQAAPSSAASCSSTDCSSIASTCDASPDTSCERCQ